SPLVHIFAAASWTFCQPAMPILRQRSCASSELRQQRNSTGEFFPKQSKTAASPSQMRRVQQLERQRTSRVERGGNRFKSPASAPQFISTKATALSCRKDRDGAPR